MKALGSGPEPRLFTANRSVYVPWHCIPVSHGRRRHEHFTSLHADHEPTSEIRLPQRSSFRFVLALLSLFGGSIRQSH